MRARPFGRARQKRPRMAEPNNNENLMPSILLVDDEEGIRRVLGLSLADEGYRVQTASGADEALSAVKTERPDIVLTDIKMPGRSGLELLAEIKALDKDIEVIMLTGHGDLDLAIQSLKLEATDFLTKPVNDELLDFALRRARERIRMRREIRRYSEHLEEMVKQQSAKLVEAERQLAALQVMDSVTSGLRDLANALGGEEGAGQTMNDETFNEMPCFVAVHDYNLKIISINQLYRDRLGNLVGQNSWTPYKPGTVGSRGCPVRRVLETGHGQRSSHTILDKNGAEIPVIVHAAPIYDNEGDVEMVLELSVDISEVRRLREELRSTRERYRQLFEESPSYVAVVDRQMQVIEANSSFRRDFGEPRGQTCHHLYMHRETPCQNCPALRTFEDGHTHHFETVVTAQDGRPVNVLVFTVPLRDAEGNIVEVMEMSTDISELRSLQDHLSQLGLLLGSTAHGIKGLLTALDGSVYRIGSGIQRGLPERVEDGFKDIKLLVGKLRKMVLAILYYAKNRELSWEEVPVLSFAEETASLVRAKAEETGVKLTCDFAREDMGSFEADTGSVSSALVNILENGIEACAANPKPPKKGSEVAFSVWADPDEVHFVISDNGPGMDRETREKLFTLFFSSKGSSGTGIGLFVASQMVRQHGGSIRVESEPGKGATFKITLPRVIPEAQRRPAGE